MIGAQSTVACRSCAVLALILSLVSSVALAGIIRIERHDYLVHEAMDRLGFFDGKLLTAGDLDDEQSYKRSTDRHIARVDGDLSAVLRLIGFADIVLLLDDTDIQPDKRTTPDPNLGPLNEDFIILDLQTQRWRGRLFVPDPGNIDSGIFDDLVGSYEGLVIRPTEISAPTFASGSLGMAIGMSMARRRRVSARRTVRDPLSTWDSLAGEAA